MGFWDDSGVLCEVLDKRKMDWKRGAAYGGGGSTVV